MDSTLSEKESNKLSGAQRLLEAGLIFSSVFSLYLMIALYSFDPADPGFSQTAYHATVNNAAGAFGAYLSDVFLFTFGAVAYILPFAIAFAGWLLFQRIHILLNIDFFTLGLKFIGFVMLLVGLTSIFSMNVNDIYEFSAGGIIGDYISYSLIPLFNYIGASLLFIILTCSGFVLLSGISLFALIDGIGMYAIKLFMILKTSAQSIQAKFSSAPEAKNKSEAAKNKPTQESIANYNEPVIDTNAINEDIQFDQEADLAAQLFGSVSDDNKPTENSKSEGRIEPIVADDGFVEIDELIDAVGGVDTKEGISDEELDAVFMPVVQPDVNDDNDSESAENVASKETTSITPEKQKLPSELLAEKYDTMPTIDLLDRPDKAKNPITQEELDQVSRLVEARLLDYGVEAKVTDVFPGPVITRFELDLAAGVKVSKITNLSKDLARALSAASVRVVEVIPGKSVIGLEIPNKHREMVRLSEVISCDDFVNNKSELTMVLGKDIAGAPIVADLAKMPHLLVAGTTGSGKSVVVNVMIVSMLYKSTPEDVRFIMIDPKMLELSVYEGIPHLLSEVVTDMKDAANALRWCVGEMERRYKLMSALGVRNLKGYNQKIKDAIEAGETIIDPLWQPSDGMDQTAPLLEKLPAIVVVVDEFADMIMIVGKKVEELIARIAQKARAAGIHLILATQRPSVDVITGLIKANIPTRMALTVSSRVDSRTILDQQGAEQLLGHGDMLYLPQGTSIPTRAQGAFVDDHEVHAVVNDWKARGKPNYVEEILSGETTEDNMLPGEASESEDSETDALYDEALAYVTESRRASISGVQRKFRIGYNRAARIIEQMEACGVVSTPGHNGNREVIAPPPVKN